ncbi:MAG: HAD-IIA family hydrolase [Clostridia bacterium]|nr:HAD-IIA family hydrolase [Clostridia bacterium]
MRTTRDIKLFLLDLDGTIYVDNTLINGAKDRIDAIVQSGRQVCYVTNNSSKSPADYMAKLSQLGITATREQIYTSGDSAIRFLNSYRRGKRVYLVGTPALAQQLRESGVQLVDSQPDIVLVGYDTTLDYAKLSNAVTYIVQGAEYMVTHSDINCPAYPVYLPDVGCFVALIHKSCGQLPTIDCGKPSTLMGDAIASKFNIDKSQIAFVGDRLYTDIQFAINNSFLSVLVLSGETSIDMLNASGLTVDYCLPSIAQLPI